MRKVFSYLRPYTFPSIIAFSLMLIELTVELLLPLFLGLMINQGVVNQDIQNIAFWGSIMIGLALLSFLAGVLNSFLSSHVSFSYAYDLREELFSKIQSFTYAKLNKYPTSSLVTRFTNDIRQIQNTVFMVLRIMAKAPLTVLGGVIMAFVVNAQLALIFLVTVPLLILFLLWILKISSKLFKQVQSNVDDVNRVMQENLAGMRLIKAFTRRSTEENRFDDANRTLAVTTRKTFRIVESSGPVLLFVMNLSLIFIIWFGSIQTVNGQANIGEVVTMINYALRVAMAISMFSFIIMILSRTKASAERISEVLTEEDGEQEELKQAVFSLSKGRLVFENVSFRYPDAFKETLSDISFSVNAGERLAIIGATGSGKTSLFQLIPRLYEPSKGNIYVDDILLTDYSFKALRDGIGYVPQTPLLFTGSIFDNIAFGKKDATMDEVIQAAKDAQIHDTIQQLEHQYETRVGQKGVNLSGGQKQRISIARALIRKPEMLMLDDSTSALDLATEARFLQALNYYPYTVLLITQKIATAKTSDRILLLDQGKILDIGTHNELLDRSELYRAVAESQQEKEVLHAK
ncbi:putative ABC transporter ATP-binding protein YfiB [Oceanobacillus oncorhynchi subsp. incaldanensis]|uniref:ABC transporter ATP-binding protein n=3 Tax=Oceanobacillus TaxID=182709 RepID=A0ABV9JX77_9BACI|nr:ABC transporter ATP-binding protein [Oceanobacillus oncorhynchi]GIO20805.1 putative ABC transporter ATP-binding protein YfiB [Oceanobacillus oncorhynchi subsp. incaldanensis]CEI84523.1 putative ABC transporter ATP-binding protein [Oceanobacillus oncorhynchi]